MLWQLKILYNVNFQNKVQLKRIMRTFTFKQFVMRNASSVCDYECADTIEHWEVS